MVYHDYTITEMEVHHEAILRREADEQKAQANLLRTAQNAKAKQYKKFIHALEETGNRIDKATGKFQTTAENLSEDLDSAMKIMRNKKKTKNKTKRAAQQETPDTD